MKSLTALRGTAWLLLALWPSLALAAGPPRIQRDVTYLDELLGRPYNGGTPLRTTGDCLWTANPRGWGFPNDIHYVHLNSLKAFEVRVEWNGVPVAPGKTWAHASHLETRVGSPTSPLPFELSERKYIAPDDVLVALYRARNLGQTPATLTLRVTSPLAKPKRDALVGSKELHEIPVSMHLVLTAGRKVEDALTASVPVAPGAEVELRLAMAFAPSRQEAQARSAAVLAAADPLAEQVAATGRWFLETVPQIDVPDPWFEKAWAFRWEVVRRNMSRPGRGRLTRTHFQEGRWSAPWFAQPITYGAPHQLLELRWLRDPSYVRDQVLTFVDNQRGDGAFVGAKVDTEVREYTDWIAASIWDVYLVTGDRQLLSQSLEAMSRNVDYVLTRDKDGNGLPEVKDHYETGMEWQPSFFYFNDYCTDRSDPLERVDYAAAHYANTLATARAATLVGDSSRARRYGALAERVRAAVEALMWDDPSGFYYSLEATTHRMVPVREVAGFYPFAFGLGGPGRERAFDYLFDPEEFWTPFPPASSSLKCPATSQEGWPVGPGGSAAMWNGPTWPHAISLVARGLGNVLRRSGERGAISRDGLFELLSSYTMAHYQGLDLRRDFDDPILGEYYHGTRGFWKTSERDYFHSTWADLVITLLMGLVPTDDDVITIHPLLPPGVWERFLLQGVRYRGHELTLVWDEVDGEDAYQDGYEGLVLYVDGRLADFRPELEPMVVPLPR